MRKSVLFIAMSLDGYLARRDGGVDWLSGQDPADPGIDFYSEFIRSADTVVMGWNTYRQITEELSPGQWPYEALTCYVITHRQLPSSDAIQFVQQSPCDLVRRLKRQPGNSIWICGGANIIQPLIRENLIDEYDISIIPTLLGSGIRLFEESDRELRLRLLRERSSNGITELLYSAD